MRVGGSRCPNSPTGNTAIHTEIKIKNHRSHLLLELPLFPHPFSNQVSMPASPRLAPPRPRYRRLLSCLPTATHHSPPSSTSRHGMVHSDCLTAPTWRCSPHPAACLPPSSLSTAPERHLLATAVPHQVGHGCRRRHVFVSTVFQKLFSSVSSVCCVCCNGYIRMLQVYVSNISIV